MGDNDTKVFDDMDLELETNNTEEVSAVEESDDNISEDFTNENEMLNEENEDTDIHEYESDNVEENVDETEIEKEETEEENRDIQNDKPKKKKDKKKKNKKGASDEEPEPKKDIRLYILTDSLNVNMADYFQTYGINIAHIYNSIEKFTNELIFEEHEYKVVLIETGSTRFISSKKREELINAIGMCTSEEEIDVFYTDAVIKSDLKYSKGTIDKKYNWHKYKSTVDTLIELLRLTEKYNFIGNYKGGHMSQTDFEKVKGKESGIEEDSRYNLVLTLQDIKINMVNEVDNSEEIETFKMKNMKIV